MPASELKGEDHVAAVYLEVVNRILLENHKPEIPPEHEIRVSAIASFKRIVEDGNEAVDQARAAALRWGSPGVAEKSREIDAFIAAGNTDALEKTRNGIVPPRRSKNEYLSVYHPARSKDSYVIRLQPTPELLELIAKQDVELERRLHDFDTRVRVLFQEPKE